MKKEKQTDRKVLFVLTNGQLNALEPLFDKVKADNELDRTGSILLQPHYDGRVTGCYIKEWKAELVNEVLRR